MNITVISSIRFNKSRQGNWRAEATVTLPTGETAYPRLTGAALNAVLSAVKAANAPITGAQRQVQMRDGSGAAVITEYRTVPVRFTADLLGAYLDNLQGITVVGVADSATVDAMVAGVATPMVASRARAAAAPVAEPELD